MLLNSEFSRNQRFDYYMRFELNMVMNNSELNLISQFRC